MLYVSVNFSYLYKHMLLIKFDSVRKEQLSFACFGRVVADPYI